MSMGVTIGERIKVQRMSKNITQEDLAKKIGVTKQAIYKYENGIVTNIPLDRLEQIASALSVSSAYLMGWTDDPTGSGRAYTTPNYINDQPEKKLPDILYRYDELSDDQQREVLAFMEFKLAQQTKNPDGYIGKVAAFGSGPAKVKTADKDAIKKAVALAQKRKAEKEKK